MPKVYEVGCRRLDGKTGVKSVGCKPIVIYLALVPGLTPNHLRQCARCSQCFTWQCGSLCSYCSLEWNKKRGDEMEEDKWKPSPPHFPFPFHAPPFQSRKWEEKHWRQVVVRRLILPNNLLLKQLPQPASWEPILPGSRSECQSAPSHLA